MLFTALKKDIKVFAAMLIEKKPVEKKSEAPLSVVGKKNNRVRVIKMPAPPVLPNIDNATSKELSPPPTRFNTAYLKAKKHDPL